MAACFFKAPQLLGRYARYSAHFSTQWWRCYRKLEKLHEPDSSPETPPKKTKDIIGFDSAKIEGPQ
jgi:hypothetical protein